MNWVPATGFIDAAMSKCFFFVKSAYLPLSCEKDSEDCTQDRVYFLQQHTRTFQSSTGELRDALMIRIVFTADTPVSAACYEWMTPNPIAV